jgi:hypothetical protein
MMITEYAVCDSRPVKVRVKDVTSEWGFVCCDACASIVSARDSWMEVYA